MNSLSDAEKARLKDAITTAYHVEFIDDIEDFIWERIFAHVRGIAIIDPLHQTREKKLFDLVDKQRQIGWSAKAIQTNAEPGGTFEVVIQRSDIFKKAVDLGFSHLSKDSAPAVLGQALMKNWQERKIQADMISQGVRDPRVCIILKSLNRRRFTYIEQPIEIFSASDLFWTWTDEKKSGLQGWLGSSLKYRWYPGQTQFFERFLVPPNAPIISLEPRRIPLPILINLLQSHQL